MMPEHVSLNQLMELHALILTIVHWMICVLKEYAMEQEDPAQVEISCSFHWIFTEDTNECTIAVCNPVGGCGFQLLNNVPCNADNNLCTVVSLRDTIGALWYSRMIPALEESAEPEETLSAQLLSNASLQGIDIFNIILNGEAVTLLLVFANSSIVRKTQLVMIPMFVQR